MARQPRCFPSCRTARPKKRNPCAFGRPVRSASRRRMRSTRRRLRRLRGDHRARRQTQDGGQDDVRPRADSLAARWSTVPRSADGDRAALCAGGKMERRRRCRKSASCLRSCCHGSAGAPPRRSPGTSTSGGARLRPRPATRGDGCVSIRHEHNRRCSTRYTAIAENPAQRSTATPEPARGMTLNASVAVRKSPRPL